MNVREMFFGMAEPSVKLPALLALMQRFVVLLYHCASDRTKQATTGDGIQDQIAFVLRDNASLQRPNSQLGHVMAIAIVLECVRQNLEVALGIGNTRPGTMCERDVLPIFQIFPMKRMTRGLNRIQAALNAQGVANVPLQVIKSNLTRYVYNVLGTYDLAIRRDVDVPGGLRGFHVEMLVRSLMAHPQLVARLIHQTIGVSLPSSNHCEQASELFFMRFRRTTHEGLKNEPLPRVRQALLVEDVFGPARFSEPSLRRPGFVEMAKDGLEHIVPGWRESRPEWVGYEPSCGVVPPPEFDPDWLTGDADRDADDDIGDDDADRSWF